MAVVAYSYVRMSTGAQLKGDSLRRQTEKSDAYARENGLEIMRSFSLHDIGVSAFNGDNAVHGALGRFLAAIRRNEVARGSYLLVESLDRLSRQKIDGALELFLEIMRAGINVVTLADGQVYRGGSTDVSQLVISIMILSRAHEESQIRSYRLGAAWANKRANAKNALMTSRVPAWLRVSANPAKIETILERVRVVVSIFQQAAAGLGSDSITRALNRNGVRPFGSTVGWTQSYVTKILNNRAVLGECQPHRKVNGRRTPEGEPISGYFPAVVSEELFLRVQAGRRSRASGSGGRRGVSMRNLFTHVAKCAYCGSPMHVVNKGVGPKGGVFLRCANSLRGLGCISTGWRYADFEKSFLYFVREIDLSGILNAASVASKKRGLSDKLQAVTEKMHQLEVRQERALSAVDDPVFEMAGIRAKLSVTTAELLAAKAETSELEAQLASCRGETELTPEDLKAAIAELQSGDAYLFEKRVALSHRLREIVSSLHLAVAGDEALIKNKAGMNPFAQSVLASKHPSFTAVFADGVARRVVVPRHDPMNCHVNAKFIPTNAGSLRLATATREGAAFPA